MQPDPQLPRKEEQNPLLSRGMLGIDALLVEAERTLSVIFLYSLVVLIVLSLVLEVAR
jgi:hypothetical protein